MQSIYSVANCPVILQLLLLKCYIMVTMKLVDSCFSLWDLFVVSMNPLCSVSNLLLCRTIKSVSQRPRPINALRHDCLGDLSVNPVCTLREATPDSADRATRGKIARRKTYAGDPGCITSRWAIHTRFLRSGNELNRRFRMVYHAELILTGSKLQIKAIHHIHICPLLQCGYHALNCQRKQHRRHGHPLACGCKADGVSSSAALWVLQIRPLG